MSRRLLALGAALLLFAACDGGGEQADPTPAAEGGVDSAAFAELVRGRDDATFKIRYEVSSPASEEASEIVWSRRPPQASFRMETGGAAVLIIDTGEDDRSITCAQNQCFRGPEGSAGSAAQLLGPMEAFLEMVDSAEDLPGFTTRDEREIAGRTAQCAAWEFEGTLSEVCVDAEIGAVLFWETKLQNSESRWEAVEFDQPSDADFEPTGEVQDVGDLQHPS